VLFTPDIDKADPIRPEHSELNPLLGIY